MVIKAYQQYTPDIHKTAFVDETALVTGNVEIGAKSSVWPMVSIRGDMHQIKIGERTNIQDGSILHVTPDSNFFPGGKPLIIGDNVTVGHNAVLHACTIDNLSLVGMGAIVLDGSRIKSNVILGAGSLVPPNKILDEGLLWVGSPAKPVRELTTDELAYLQFSADDYVATMEQHKKNT